MKATWLGHNCWLLDVEGLFLLFDPFFQACPKTYPLDNLYADYVIVTHGHSDHVANALSVIKRCNSTVVGIAEVTDWFARKSVKKLEPMNIGGSIKISTKGMDEKGIRLMMVPALHSSTMPDGVQGGNAIGYLLSISKQKEDFELRPLSKKLKNYYNIYFAGDTGFFPGMNWLGNIGLDTAFLPVGDRYTMGPELSLDAINILRPKKVVPSHYNTWTPIAQNIDEWACAVEKNTEASPIVFKPGETKEL